MESVLKQKAWKAGLVASALALLLIGMDARGDEPQFVFGACTHFGQRKGTLEENLSLLKQCGVMSTRDEATWSQCEKERGSLKIPPFYADYVDKASGMGFSPLSILDYSNSLYDGGGYPRSSEAIEAFARYAELVVSTFKGKAKLYQVWNEWDAASGMPPGNFGKGDPESYMKLLKAVYPRIKAIDPSAIVIGNSVCTGDAYLKSLLELGLLEHCDVVALHTYHFSRPEPTPESWLERMEGVDRMLRGFNGGKEVPLFITETGWPTQISDFGRTQSEAADCVVRQLLLARTMPFIKGIWLYDFQDDGWDPRNSESNFGLTKADLTPKEAFYALRDLIALLKGARFAERLEAGDPKIWVLRFETQGDESIYALWSAYKDDDWEITLSSQAEVKGVFKLTTLGRGSVNRSFGARSWAENRGASFDPKLFQTSVRGRPVLLKGDLKGLAVAKVERRPFPERMRPKTSVAAVPKKIVRIHSAGSGKPTESFDFGEERDYVRVQEKPRAGRKDFGASFSASYDKDSIRISVKVTDEVFVMADDPAKESACDSLSLFFQTLPAKMTERSDSCEFHVFMSKDGPIVRRASSSVPLQLGLAKEVSAKIDVGDGTTDYEIEVPAKSLGLDAFKPGMALGFSIVANDDDGQGREGRLHWGDGAERKENPGNYNWLCLED